jgi:hypothetical protein
MTTPVGLTVAGVDTEVLVAGGEKAATAELLMFSEGGDQVDSRAVTVPPSGLVSIPVPGRTAYAVLLPRAGGGYAAAVHTTPGAAVQLATLLPTSVTQPVVQPYTGPTTDPSGSAG